MCLHTFSQIILTPLFLEFIGEYEFGIYGIMMTALNLCGAGVGWIIGPYNRVINKNINRNRLSKILVIGRIFFIGYILAIIAISLIIFIALRLSNHTRVMFDLNILIIYVMVLIASYYFIADRLLLNQINKQVLGNALDALRTLVFFIIIFFFINRFSSLQFVLVSLFLSIIIQILIIKVINKYNKFIIQKIYLKDLLNYAGLIIRDNSLNYGIYSAVNVFNQMDILIVGYLGGGVEAAKYILIMKIPEIIISVLARIPGAMEPKIMQYSYSNDVLSLKINQRKFFKLYFIVCLVISVVYSVSIESIAKIWVGDYLDIDGFIYNIIAIIIFFSSLNKWNLTFIIGLGRVNELVKTSIIECTMKILFTILFYINYGINGVIFSSLLINVIFYFKYNRLFLKKNV